MIRKLVVLLFILILFVTLYFLARDHFTWVSLIDAEADLRAWIEHRPLPGFLAGFAIYTGVSLAPGTTGKALVAAWLFGFWGGLVIVNLGLTLAAILSFLATRYLFQDIVASGTNPWFARMNEAIEREGASYLFTARVLHLPFCLTNYAMGATSIRLRSFWWSTQLGIIPGNIFFVYAGSQIPSLQMVEEEGPLSIFTPSMALGFAAICIFPLLARLVVQTVRTN